MIEFRVVVTGNGSQREEVFGHPFDGEPQINLTFEHGDAVYRIVTRAHDEHAGTPTVHAERI